MRVRRNRRALSASGRDRSDNPVDLVASQIWDELSVDAPLLPAACLSEDADSDAVSVSASFRAHEHEPMFDAGIVRAPNGEAIDLGSYARARLADRLLRIGFRSPLLIPTDSDLAAEIVDVYDKALKALEERASSMARAQIGKENSGDVCDVVIRLWHHACHAAGGGDRHLS